MVPRNRCVLSIELATVLPYLQVRERVAASMYYCTWGTCTCTLLAFLRQISSLQSQIIQAAMEQPVESLDMHICIAFTTGNIYGVCVFFTLNCSLLYILRIVML